MRMAGAVRVGYSGRAAAFASYSVPLHPLYRLGDIVFVTHDPALAERAGRTIEMRDGQVVSSRAGLGAATAAGQR
jgi:ABC-type siderophore export system fused ATPase/permease subunit